MPALPLLYPVDTGRSIFSGGGGRRATRHWPALARIFPSDDVPVARGLMMCGKSKQGVKRDMPMEAPIVAEHEFIEIAVDVLAAQAVICAEAPSLHQRESAMNPRQDNVARHLADDA